MEAYKLKEFEFFSISENKINETLDVVLFGWMLKFKFKNAIPTPGITIVFTDNPEVCTIDRKTKTAYIDYKYEGKVPRLLINWINHRLREL